MTSIEIPHSSLYFSKYILYLFFVQPFLYSYFEEVKVNYFQVTVNSLHVFFKSIFFLPFCNSVSSLSLSHTHLSTISDVSLPSIPSLSHSSFLWQVISSYLSFFRSKLILFSFTFFSLSFFYLIIPTFVFFPDMLL